MAEAKAAPSTAQPKTAEGVKGYIYHVKEYQRIKQQERKFVGKVLHGLIDPFDTYIKASKLRLFAEKYGKEHDGKSAILTDALVKRVLDSKGIIRTKGSERDEAIKAADSAREAHELMMRLAGGGKDSAEDMTAGEKSKATDILGKVLDKVVPKKSGEAGSTLSDAEINALIEAHGISREDVQQLQTRLQEMVNQAHTAGLDFQRPENMKDVLSDQVLYAGLTPEQRALAHRVAMSAHLAAGLTAGRYVVAGLTGGQSLWISMGASAGASVLSRYAMLKSQGQVYKANQERGVNFKSTNAAGPGVIEKALSKTGIAKFMSVDWTDDESTYKWQMMRALAFGAGLGLGTHLIGHPGELGDAWNNITHHVDTSHVVAATHAPVSADVAHPTAPVEQNTADYLHAHGAQSINTEHHTVVADQRQYEAYVQADKDGGAELTLPPGDNAIGIPQGDGSVTMLHFDNMQVHDGVTTIHVGPNDPNYQVLINSEAMKQFFADKPNGGTMLDGVHNGATTTYITGHWDGNVFEQHSTVNGSYPVPEHVTVHDATQATVAAHETSGPQVHDQSELLKNQQETPIRYEGDTIHHDWQQLHTYVHHDSNGHYWVEMKYQPQDATAGQTQYLALIHDGKPIILDNNIKLDGNDYTTMINIYDTQGHVIDHMSSAQLAHWLGVDDQAKLQMFDKISTGWQATHLKDSLPDDVIKYQGGNMSYTQHAADLYQNVGRQFGADGSPLLNARVAGGHLENGQFFAGASNQTGGALPAHITLNPPHTQDLDHDEAMFRTDVGRNLDRWTDEHLPQQTDSFVDNNTILNTDTWVYLWRTDPGGFVLRALPFIALGAGYGYTRSRVNPPKAGKILTTVGAIGYTALDPIGGGIGLASYLAARFGLGGIGKKGDKKDKKATDKEKQTTFYGDKPWEPFGGGDGGSGQGGSAGQLNGGQGVTTPPPAPTDNPGSGPAPAPIGGVLDATLPAADGGLPPAPAPAPTPTTEQAGEDEAKKESGEEVQTIIREISALNKQGPLEAVRAWVDTPQNLSPSIMYGQLGKILDADASRDLPARFLTKAQRQQIEQMRSQIFSNYMYPSPAPDNQLSPEDLQRIQQEITPMLGVAKPVDIIRRAQGLPASSLELDKALVYLPAGKALLKVRGSSAPEQDRVQAALEAAQRGTRIVGSTAGSTSTGFVSLTPADLEAIAQVVFGDTNPEHVKAVTEAYHPESSEGQAEEDGNVYHYTEEDREKINAIEQDLRGDLTEEEMSFILIPYFKDKDAQLAPLQGLHGLDIIGLDTSAGTGDRSAKRQIYRNDFWEHLSRIYPEVKGANGEEAYKTLQDVLPVNADFRKAVLLRVMHLFKDISESQVPQGSQIYSLLPMLVVAPSAELLGNYLEERYGMNLDEQIQQQIVAIQENLLNHEDDKDFVKMEADLGSLDTLMRDYVGKKQNASSAVGRS